MSKWTYVHGVIQVDTCARSSAEAIYLAQTVVNHLPRITGSEGDVQYYLNLVCGRNSSSSSDEFGQESNLYDDRYHQTFETQSCVLITLSGSLRDRMFEETLLETTNALSRLSSRLFVNNCLVSVSSFSRSFVFNDPSWIIDRDVSNWAEKLIRPDFCWKSGRYVV